MLDIPYAQFKKCCACEQTLRNKKNIHGIGESTIERTRIFFNNNQIQVNDLICGNCRTKAYQNKKNFKSSMVDVDKSSIVDDDSYTFNKNIADDEEDVEIEDLELLNGSNIDANNVNHPSNNKKEKMEHIGVVKNQIELFKAPSTHKHCLMCKKKTGLHMIKIESVIFAYKYYGTIINKDSRCCSSHFESNGDIKEKDFQRIKKTIHSFDKKSIEILDLCVMNAEKVQQSLTESCGIFDKFKDIASIENDICKNITGWCKLDFIRFSQYIKNIRDSAGRTKEQLIAIYRFWLLKGLDQSTLAMLKFDTSQQQISHYLCQIRNAINKEFVPEFLGAHKGKEFFLKHNTESVRILHDFVDDDLAIIADGTYTRLEKSANNEFQYLSYSSQKLDNLIKPFILCCADGYFIDCYGPFQASFNDAAILKYILETDKDLKNILYPSDKIMFFLDRGFRNLYWHLVKDGFKVKIPTCQQLSELKQAVPDLPEELAVDDLNEQKILSTSQASDTRLVTKVRFVIEKQNSYLKNKKALDYIRNTQAGHIQIDYRICCAMANFKMIPCVPDGKYTVEIANRIKRRTLRKQNKLKSILSMCFSKTITFSDITSVTDFPQLTIKQIQRRITLGSFKLKLSKSYIDQIKQYGIIYSLEKKQIEQYVTSLKVRSELNYSKIVAVLIPSRHKRSKLNNIDDQSDVNPKNFKTYYKTFIQYTPVSGDTDKTPAPYKNIKRYICNCLSGLQVAGCCVHVASVIYYMSYIMRNELKSPNFFKSPSKHLNSILVNPKIREKSNQPRYVSHKRTNDPIISESESSSGETSDSISSDEEIIITEKERNKETKRREKQELKGGKKQRKTTEKQTISTNQNINLSESKVTISGRNTEEKTSIIKKQVASLKETVTVKIESTDKKSSVIENVLNNVDLIVKNFNSTIPPWGGYFKQDERIIKVVNTCTIDNYLFAFWVMSQIVPNFLERLPPLEQTIAMKTIVNNIDTKDWNMARQNWYTLIMKKNIRTNEDRINFFGEVEVFFLNYVYSYQTHSLLQKCKSNCVYNGNLIISDHSNIIAFAKLKKQNIDIVSSGFNVCNGCHERITCEIQFKHKTLFVFMETRTHFKIHQVPEQFYIHNRYFKILCSILYIQQKKHFVSVFHLGGQKYLVDDLQPNQSILLNENDMTHRKYFKYNISSALYHIVE